VRRRARRLGGRSGRKRRQTDWIVSAEGLVLDPSPAFGDTVLIDLINDIDLDDHDDQLTVVRIVGELHFWDIGENRCDTAINWRGFAGIYKTESDATGAVIELAPDDGIDGDSEAWMWRHSFIAFPQGLSISPDLGNSASSLWKGRYSTHIDLRVMRKMGGREHLVLAFRLFTDGSGSEAGYNALLQLRTLVKLA